jgi:cytochrome c biogenesis protein CcmG, thiol:disulfide interchange protein DsbE
MAKHFRFWLLINRAPKLRAGVLLFATLCGTLFATLSGTLFATLFVTPLGAQTSLPNLFARSLEGKEVRLADFLKEGKPLVISFWATWCNPCVEELEAVSQRFESWQKEIDFKFVAISVDDARSTSKVRSFVSGREWPFTVLLDANQDIMKAMNISSVPFTMILNREGVVKYSHSGYIPGDENTIIKELKKLIDEK